MSATPMAVRTVLVTGSETAFGRAVVAALAQRGLEPVEQPTLRAPADTGGTAAGYGTLAAIVADVAPDALVHAALVSAGAAPDVDVITTMRLAAAVAQPGSTVRSVVAVSSAAVYSASSRSPLLRREVEELRPAEGTLAAEILEAEGYLRALADDAPHISVAILRLADVAGARMPGPLVRLLRRRAVPAVLGFDPAVQFLDGDDAAAAVVHAVRHELPGTYNVAGAGTVRWSEAVRLARRRRAPFPPVLAPVATALGRVPLGPGALDPDTLDVLRYGRCLDTSSFGAAGFTPARTTADCARAQAPAG